MNKLIHPRLSIVICFVLGLILFSNIAPAVSAKARPRVTWIEGGQTISIANLATLKLPKGYLFANGNDTSKLMEYMGNPVSNKFFSIAVAIGIVSFLIKLFAGKNSHHKGENHPHSQC